MTDKQSTVVVSRELAVRVSSRELGMSAKKDRAAAAHELRALLAVTPEQAVDVGEPVAWMNEHGEVCSAHLQAHNLKCSEGSARVAKAYSIPLYRHAQPPARVVLPERRPDDYPSPRTRDCWNACLDAVLKLNSLE